MPMTNTSEVHLALHIHGPSRAKVVAVRRGRATRKHPWLWIGTDVPAVGDVINRSQVAAADGSGVVWMQSGDGHMARTR